MSLPTAVQIWGAEAVARALAEEAPAEMTEELARQVAQRADPPGAFRAWALALPWPTFCAVVRIVAGVTRQELLGGREA